MYRNERCSQRGSEGVSPQMLANLIGATHKLNTFVTSRPVAHVGLDDYVVGLVGLVGLDDYVGTNLMEPQCADNYKWFG